jgi:hypothetical protein
MSNFLHLSDEEKDQNKETNSAHTFVDKERIRRLKRNFIPFWMREIKEQERVHDENSSKRDQENIEPK